MCVARAVKPDGGSKASLPECVLVARVRCSSPGLADAQCSMRNDRCAMSDARHSKLDPRCSMPHARCARPCDAGAGRAGAGYLNDVCEFNTGSGEWRVLAVESGAPPSPAWDMGFAVGPGVGSGSAGPWLYALGGFSEDGLCAPLLCLCVLLLWLSCAQALLPLVRARPFLWLWLCSWFRPSHSLSLSTNPGHPRSLALDAR